MPIPLSIDLMEVSSYGAATESSGQVRILKDLSTSDRGAGGDRGRGHHRHRPDAELPAALPARQGPASIRICCLLDKPARRLAPIEIDYRGFTIADRFVIGYGLDYGERYRNLPYIGVLRPSVYGAAPPA